MADPVVLCADVAAAWHASWLKALGIESERRDGIWRALAKPPVIYFAGITLVRDVGAERVADVPGSVCDAWQTLDLTPYGFHVFRREPWFYRPAGPADAATPPELEIVAVSTPEEVYEFEAVSVRGFGGEDAFVEAGATHPPAVLRDEAMKMFTGRVDGRPVAAAMGYRTDDVVGVFGVATVASARRRGYGAALTRAAMQAETGLPAILAPSEKGAALYRRLGFERVGELAIWSKGP
ncbi:MAG: GNAT family N-acetyltransferase [Gaiellaceae bacterium]